MDQHNQYNSLLGDTSDLHLVISEEKYLMASPGLISGKFNLQQRQLTCSPAREQVWRYLSRVMIRMVNVKCLVHLVTLCRGQEFFKNPYR